MAVGISVFWYFVQFLPEQSEQKRIAAIKEQDLENEIKCKDAGKKIIHFPGQFRFNKELNACLYKGAFVNTNNDLIFSKDYIIDVYTNEIIVEIENIADQPKEIRDQFDRKISDLGFRKP